ncbi:MAG TPA: SHOCT domain-containing protein [Rhizomicrobium sp.]|nr:SHOCT domain-containing protein [Rhizomicrobium sp.]
MPATAVYNVAMAQTDAFEFVRGAVQAAGAVLGAQTPPSGLAFALTRKDSDTGSIDVTMPGRAVIAVAPEGASTVTLAIEPATQFVVYALGIGLAALLFGSFFFGGLNGLWFLLVIAAEGYLFWSVFNRWPAEALAVIDAKMRASPSVTGGAPVVQPAAPIFSPPPQTTTAADAADIADQIRRLAELRDQGHLTQDEFDAKKTELLKRI